MPPNKRKRAAAAKPPSSPRRPPAAAVRHLLALPAISDPARILGMVTTYLAELLAANYRPRSIATYKKALTRCAPLYARCKDAGALLVALGELAPATCALYLSTVRSFEAWAVRGGYLDRAVYDGKVRVKLDQAAPRPVALANLAKLDQAAAQLGGRAELLYLLMREAGLRIGEALALHWPDVVLEPGREGLQLRATKGRADCFVPLEPGRLLARLRRAGSRERDAVLGRGERHVIEPASWPPRGLGYDAALVEFGKLCKLAGVVATPHRLRHSRATELGASGMSVFALRAYFGWARLDHAARYVDVGDVRAELRRVAGDTTPRPNRRRRGAP